MSINMRRCPRAVEKENTDACRDHKMTVMFFIFVICCFFDVIFARSRLPGHPKFDVFTDESSSSAVADLFDPSLIKDDASSAIDLTQRSLLKHAADNDDDATTKILLGADLSSTELIDSASTPHDVTIEYCREKVFGPQDDDVCTKIGVTVYGGCSYSVDTTCLQMKNCRKTIAAMDNDCLFARTGLVDGEVYCEAVHDAACDAERDSLRTMSAFIDMVLATLRARAHILWPPGSATAVAT